MADGRNPEQALAGEASRSTRKRRRTLRSYIVEQEQGENGGRTASDNPNVDGGEVITEVRSGTVIDLALLDCPVCCIALAAPIYQCDSGHVACSSCCVNLRYKCPACTLPIGNYRCRIMERVLEAITFPCANAKHGCPKKFSYGKELAHEKQCSFALCHYPAPECNYAGVCKDLYRHYNDNHRDVSKMFVSGCTFGARMRIRDKVLVLQECGSHALVVVQCFEETNGVNVAVKCIGPCSAQGLGEFSFRLSCPFGGKTMSFESEMSMIQKVSFQTPGEDFMSIPAYCMANRVDLEMNICIRRRGEEEGR
ncbi:unnamed protein product [Microthlaspi erraticum]|uniref:RING-type E3 ubiquitin transferase n=1 Tax=Microthlaspi erraticum TaxID=1685480 RepID=A0A6D2I2A7_9BRAS|nr:unnamed protein product [Microthlaspi erraticum]